MTTNNQFDLLAKRLQEITANMKPEDIDARWGRGYSRYLQNVDQFMSYLSKKRRDVEEKKEQVPQAFYEQTSALEFPALKQWYQNNMGLKPKEKNLKNIVYHERMLELIAKKFGVSIEATPRGKVPDSRIRTSKDLMTLCDTDPKARYLVKLCQGDDVDVADIIAVVYDGKIQRDDAIKLLQEPSLREYLGEFRKPVGMPDIEEYANTLLPFDKNGVIASIIYKRLIEYRRDKLGAKPTAQQRTAFVQEMNKTLEDLV